MGHTGRFFPSIDYHFYSLPGFSARFRGPIAQLKRPFLAIWGGSDLFGRYVPEALSHFLARDLDQQVVNFSIQQAGVDALMWQGLFERYAQEAQMNIIQTLPILNASNPYYKVHPLRNDRVTLISPKLKALFPEARFEEVYFIGHLWQEVKMICPDRAKLMRADVSGYVQKKFDHMLELVPQDRRIVVDVSHGGSTQRVLGPEDTISYGVSHEVLSSAQLGMIFQEFERVRASQVLSAQAHKDLAAMLAERICGAGDGRMAA